MGMQSNAHTQYIHLDSHPSIFHQEISQSHSWSIVQPLSLTSLGGFQLELNFGWGEIQPVARLLRHPLN